MDEIRLDDKAFEPVAPVFKNWIYKEYGVPAVTYEVSDVMPPGEIERVAVRAAESLMRLVMGEPRLPGRTPVRTVMTAQ